jgi:hypothetical protein
MTKYMNLKGGYSLSNSAQYYKITQQINVRLSVLEIQTK